MSDFDDKSDKSQSWLSQRQWGRCLLTPVVLGVLLPALCWDLGVRRGLREGWEEWKQWIRGYPQPQKPEAKP